MKGGKFEEGLYLREGKRGSSYYYKFKFKGEVYEGSTDTDSPREAKKFLEALKTDLRNRAKRLESTRLSLPTLSRVHADWLELAETQFSSSHRDSFDSYWRLHLEPMLGGFSLDRVTTEAVERCRGTYLTEGGSPGGANNLLKTLNTLFGFAIRRKILVVRPYDIKRLTVQRKPRVVLPADAVGIFLSSIDKSRNANVKGIVRMMLGLGLRENEALNARWEHLDLRRKTYQPAKTKTGKSQMLPVPDWLADFLRDVPGRQPAGFMFLAQDGLPHRAHFTQKPIARAGKAVGLERLTPHRLRATFATLHHEAGTKLQKIQQMLGHSEITTTMRYVEDSTAGLREAQASVAKAMGFGVTSNLPTERNAKGGKDGGKKKSTPRKSSRSRSSVG